MKNTKVTFLVATALLTGALSLVAAPAPVTEIWENSCASCHGAEGKGDTRLGRKLKLKDYTDKAALAGYSDERLAAAIRDGVREGDRERKKGFGDELSEEEISALVKFIRGMAK